MSSVKSYVASVYVGGGFYCRSKTFLDYKRSEFGLFFKVGASFLETVVRKFDEVYKNPSEGKESDNLLAIIGHLYNFQVVHSLLIFDILKLLVRGFAEKDVELVLFTLKNVGFALRKDDALALKELISEGQRKAGEMGSKFQDQTRVGATAFFIQDKC